MIEDDEKINVYRKYRNLKLAAQEIGIAWQSLYVYLVKKGEPVIGDKKRYGSTKDKLASKFESRFRGVVPFAIENNSTKYQAKIDFFVGDYSVDVKVSSLQLGGKQPSGKKFTARWSYCISKQKQVADFFVLYALGSDESVSHVFLIPKEIAITSTTISIPLSMNSKWSEYELIEPELFTFFNELTGKEQAA
jgi:hypothetical protein